MIQIINISLIPSENKPVINVSQFDNISRVLRFNVFDDADMETPHIFDDGDTVLLNIRKNDNNIVVITGDIITETDPETQEVTAYYLTFELTEQACACVGSNYGEVSITSGDDEVIGSCNFKLIVERSPLSGGVSSQTAIDNLTTQVEQITEEIIGDNYYDKEEIDGKFDELDIPTKTSQLTNDSGFITASDIPTIPTKTSQLTNDSGFITASDIPTIPTKTSQLTNDSGFTTIDDAATVNNKTWSSNKISNELINLLPTATATGNLANFTTSYALPLEFIKAFIVAVQASGTPTPASPLPISGFDNVTITHADENMQTVETVVISLGQTVYGGYVSQDKNGKRELVVTHALIDLGTMSWFKQATNLFYTQNNSIKGNSVCTCEIYAYQNVSLPPTRNDKTINTATYFGLHAFSVYDTDYDDRATFKASLSGKYCVYELAEPFTVELPNGEHINALVGTNNVYADSGDCEVTYKCSINEAINAAIASQSNRTLSLMRSSEILETIEPIERGDNNENER